MVAIRLRLQDPEVYRQPCPLGEVHPAGHSPAVNMIAGLSADGVYWEDYHAVTTGRERPQWDWPDPGGSVRPV